MAELLNQLPNGGAVFAIVVVSVIYLKAMQAMMTMFVEKQEKDGGRAASTIEKVVANFLVEIAESRRDYLDRLDRLTGRPADERKGPK